ncbi:hypothetical protein ATJ78_0122 [Paramicrobacterium agarici]|uniref:Uncharacterized protein n=2 Tax=Paramicrobacterium agarici TaxID=630514 RepID=A0A2A9DRK4_9MICO|nr:hypothetical protein ATJ78_0122 [Microbacterium agarici]
MKADRILYRLTAEQIAYLGDGFPWTVTAEDLMNAPLLDAVRQAALRLGREAALLTHPQTDPSRCVEAGQSHRRPTSRTATRRLWRARCQ